MSEMNIQKYRETLGAKESQMAMALPDHISPQKINRVIITEISKNPRLLKCSRESVLTSAMEACQLGLVPNSVQGLAYLIPYGTKCQLITGYKGLISLALQSGRLASIWGRIVREGDHFEYEEGTNPFIHHKPTVGKKGDKSGAVVGAYAVAKMKGGEDTQFEFLSLLDIERVKARSSSGSKGPWVDDYEQMAKKTAVRALLKWLPLESERVELAAGKKEGRGSGYTYDMEKNDFIFVGEEEETTAKSDEIFS